MRRAEDGGSCASLREGEFTSLRKESEDLIGSAPTYRIAAETVERQLPPRQK